MSVVPDCVMFQVCGKAAPSLRVSTSDQVPVSVLPHEGGVIPHCPDCGVMVHMPDCPSLSVKVPERLQSEARLPLSCAT